MPELSRFYGIIIYLYWKDHAPPHFHAEYGDDEAVILIDNWAVYEGSLLNRALKLVREWAGLPKEEIVKAWEKAVAGKPFKIIEPLR